MSYDIVIPTLGRPSLHRLLDRLHEEALRTHGLHAPRLVVVVDDRPTQLEPLVVGRPAGGEPTLEIRVVRSEGRGPAAARNRGWHATVSPWVSFLDDDVVVMPGWMIDLAHDLDRVGETTGAVQGTLTVPLPVDRRPTDRERSVAGLAGAPWITADLTVRRSALQALGGFDERFPRAYREDTDFALRLVDAGWMVERGRRRVEHPVGRAPWTASLSAQRGNADDALINRLHGPGWRARASARRGAFASHLITVGLTVVALLAAAVGRGRPSAGGRLVSTPAGRFGALALYRIVSFAIARIRPGPARLSEATAMAITSPLIPFLAVSWRFVGWRRALRLTPRGNADQWHIRRPRAVLFDRDGTLIDDVPYNGDPEAVCPVPGAAAVLHRLRTEGIAVGIISNQSAVAKGMLTADQVEAVNGRVRGMLGPFSTVQWCPHDDVDRCGCRKPEPGLVVSAAAELGLAPSDCAVVGDIGADVAAGLAAGARPILVPNARTRPEEVSEAPEVATDLMTALDALLGGRRLPSGEARLARVRPLGREQRMARR